MPTDRPLRALPNETFDEWWRRLHAPENQLTDLAHRYAEAGWQALEEQVKGLKERLASIKEKMQRKGGHLDTCSYALNPQYACDCGFADFDAQGLPE